MKTKFLNYSLAVLILCGGYIINQTVAQAVSANQPVNIRKSVWKLFYAPDGSFQILMPGTPQEVKQIVNAKYGNIKLHIFTVERQKEEVKYVVGYTANGL